MFLLKKTEKIIDQNSKVVKNTTNKLDFKIYLKQSANLELDNGNGYGIAKIHKLEDMI